jgi:transcriptional regulator with XRE-family HTH domain
MPNRRRSQADAARAGRRQLAEVADDLREARLAAGLTQASVASRTGLAQAQISRLERGDYPAARVDDLARLAGALGLQLSLRVYPGPGPLRDAAQLALISRLRARLHASWTVRLEVPIPGRGDLRAWDLVVAKGNLRIGVEAVTRLRDIQALLRSVRAKQRDSAVDRVLIVLADTSTNRRALASASQALADTPWRTRSVLAALESGRDPGCDAFVAL